MTSNLPFYSRRGESAEAGSTFNDYLRISPVVLIYGNGRATHASEHRNSLHLMREIQSLAAEGVRIRGVFDSERGVLSMPSLRALNCYLRHGFHRFSHCAGRLSGSSGSRFAWSDLCSVVSLQWQPAALS
jgi:hypothetical protein